MLDANILRSVGDLLSVVLVDQFERTGIERDAKGFVTTEGIPGGARRPFETSLAGAFAIGDVRSGSVKRVAASVGEGAGVVASIHAYLADADRAKDSQLAKESAHA